MICPEQEGYEVTCKKCTDDCPIYCEDSENCRAFFAGRCRSRKLCRRNKFRYFFTITHIKDWIFDLNHSKRFW